MIHTPPALDKPKRRRRRPRAESFMAKAIDAALDSKDDTQVGAALIGDDGTCLLQAHNGPARGVHDYEERFERPRKYLFAMHAERNLINFAAKRGIRTDGCTVYVTHAPCAECVGSMIQAGIRKIVFGPGTTAMPAETFEAGAMMASEANVPLVKYADELKKETGA